MTRIPGDYIGGEVALRVNSGMQRLNTESDDALEARVREGILCADGRDISGIRLGFWELMAAPVEFYDGMAAMRLLGERHGEDYVLNLTGYRRAETTLEKVKCFFTGKLIATK